MKIEERVVNAFLGEYSFKEGSIEVKQYTIGSSYHTIYHNGNLVVFINNGTKRITVARSVVNNPLLISILNYIPYINIERRDGDWYFDGFNKNTESGWEDIDNPYYKILNNLGVDLSIPQSLKDKLIEKYS